MITFSFELYGTIKHVSVTRGRDEKKKNLRDKDTIFMNLVSRGMVRNQMFTRRILEIKN